LGDLIVVGIRTIDRLFKDGWIRSHAVESIDVDQPAEFLRREQVAPNVVEPYALAEAFQLPQWIFCFTHGDYPLV